MTAIFESSKLEEQMPLDPFLTDELGKLGDETNNGNLIIVENHPTSHSLHVGNIPNAAHRIELRDPRVKPPTDVAPLKVRDIAHQIELRDPSYPLGRVREEVELSYPLNGSAEDDKNASKTPLDMPAKALDAPAKAKSTPEKLDQNLVLQLEAAHSKVLDSWAATESKGRKRIKAQQRLEEAQAAEKQVLDELGFSSYTEFMVSGRVSGNYGYSKDNHKASSYEQSDLGRIQSGEPNYTKLGDTGKVPEIAPKLSLRERAKNKFDSMPSTLREAYANQRELFDKLNYRSKDLSDDDYSKLMSEARTARYKHMPPQILKSIAIMSAATDIAARGFVKLINTRTFQGMVNNPQGVSGSEEVFSEGVPDHLKTPQFELSDPRYVLAVLALGGIATGLVVANERYRDRPRLTHSQKVYFSDDKREKQPRRHSSKVKTHSVEQPERVETSGLVASESQSNTYTQILSKLKSGLNSRTSRGSKQLTKKDQENNLPTGQEDPATLPEETLLTPALAPEAFTPPEPKPVKRDAVSKVKSPSGVKIVSSKANNEPVSKDKLNKPGVHILQKPKFQAQKGFKLDKNGLYIPEGYDSEYAVLKEAMRIGKQQGLGSIRYTDKH